MECVSKSEVDWTDAEEQVSIGNARALNAIFNGVDLNDTDDSEEADGGTNAFIVNIIETDSAIEDESGNFEEEGEDNLSLEQLEIK
ncbi:uncharacterized protein E6C27_scaffold186G002370 [Cucumis melo var. makuwa]|uniref:Uncharacterized protein n=1 Tax=Cucumis melo var. makuwa TaxID=1194695 RepID=A0A5A7USH7_CUCMM|nr:uncharacterized protein E6C27_scaffold186G002370 [Cucumis melo var. makuwa]